MFSLPKKSSKFVLPLSFHSPFFVCVCIGPFVCICVVSMRHNISSFSVGHDFIYRRSAIALVSVGLFSDVMFPPHTSLSALSSAATWLQSTSWPRRRSGSTRSATTRQNDDSTSTSTDPHSLQRSLLLLLRLGGVSVAASGCKVSAVSNY